MAIMNFKDNKLTPELKEQLIQGTKVEFKWYGSDSLYIGRIEMRDGRHYFVNEHCYENDILVQKGMKYYNPLDSFHCFSHFKILDKMSKYEYILTLKDNMPKALKDKLNTILKDEYEDALKEGKNIKHPLWDLVVNPLIKKPL